MKKHCFLIALLLGTSVLCLAQTRYTAAVWRDSGFDYTDSDNPIRNWRQNYSISFVKDGVNGYFVLIDHADFYTTPLPIVFPSLTPAPPTCNVYHAPMPRISNIDDIEVKDIYIVGDMAFYCGCYTDTTIDTAHIVKPLWGYIDLNEFFSSNMTIFFYTLQDGTGTSAGVAPYWLNRLVAYKNGSTYNVVAYSRASYPCCKIIEIQDALGMTPSFWTYDLPIAPPPVSMCEMYIDDMVLDDNYVIVSGHDLSVFPLDRVWYGIYDRTNISSTINNTFVFPASEMPTGSVICTDIKGTEEFALAYSYYEEIPDAWYTRIRFINKTTGDNTHSQQFAKVYKFDPLRMTFLDDLSSIELIQEREKGSDFVLINPFASSSYTTSKLEMPNYSFYNIDFIGGHHFITAYRNFFYLQDRTINLPASTNTCPDDSSVKISPIPDLVPTTPYIIPYNSLTNINLSQPVIITNNSIKAECFSYE